uniref:Extensin domain-containing protein n=2 Tax=Oryza TaxID=4527 RepID=A0A0D3FVR8_9ORYZ
MGGKVALLVVLVAMSVVLLETQAKTKPKAEEKPPKTKEHRLLSHPDKPPPYRNSHTKTNTPRTPLYAPPPPLPHTSPTPEPTPPTYSPIAKTTMRADRWRRRSEGEACVRVWGGVPC